MYTAKVQVLAILRVGYQNTHNCAAVTSGNKLGTTEDTPESTDPKAQATLLRK